MIQHYHTIKVRFKLIVLSTMIAFPFIAQSTTPKSGGKLSGGFGYFSFSGEQSNLGALNNSLRSNGYGSLSNFAASLGGGGMVCVNNFLFGGSGAWILGQNTHSSENSLNLSGGYGYVDFGYVVYSGKHSVLYPSLGIGGGSYNIAITKKNLPEDFSQQLNTPAGMTITEVGGWIMNVQLAYQLFLNKENKEGWCVGFKAGYKYSLGSWQNKVNNTSVSNSPGINMNGLYGSIIFGGGSLFSE